MRKILGLIIFLTCTFAIDRTQAQSNPQTDLQERLILQDKMEKANIDGNYIAAVNYAQHCMELGGFNCKLYYARALSIGQGIARNEYEAVRIFEETLNDDPDAGLSLARLYLEGVQIAHNPVEAQVLVWRAYETSNGLCHECDSIYKEIKLLQDKLDKELSPQQKIQAQQIEQERYPKLSAIQRKENLIKYLIILFAITACCWKFIISKQVRLSKIQES